MKDFEKIYALRENTFDDFKACINSDEMSEFIETTGCEITSTSAQYNNGTIEFEAPNGQLFNISKEGYLRVQNRSGEGTHLLNKRIKVGNGTTTEKLSYMEALKTLMDYCDRNKSKVRDPFEYKSVFGFQDKKVDKLNARRANTTQKYLKPKSDSIKCKHCGKPNLSGGILCPNCSEEALSLLKKKH